MVIYSLIEGWFNFVNSSKATPFDKKQFQMKQVHSLIKKWIPQLQANNYSNELVQKFKILENRIPI